MNTFSTILAAAQSKLKEVEGNVAATQDALIELVIDLTNDATQHGKNTNDSQYPKHQHYWSTLYVYLREAGFDLLGSGFFSIAVSHPALPERVLKVGLKKEDSAAAYTAWCRMNQGRAGVPAVHATKRSTGCYVVVLDELFPLDLEKLSEFKGFRAASQGLYDCGFEYEGDNALRALYETALSIREFFKGLAQFDLHEGNVMVDAAGNVVITDPVSYTQGVSEGASWALVDNTDALTALKREQIAERARVRHQRNQERQQLRKAQKARNKERKARLAEMTARRKEKMAVIFDELSLFDGFIAPNIVQPDPEQVDVVLRRIRQQFAPALQNLPKRIEWDPREPLSMKLPRLVEELKQEHQQRTGMDPHVIQQINGLDKDLDAQFLMG